MCERNFENGQGLTKIQSREVHAQKSMSQKCVRSQKQVRSQKICAVKNNPQSIFSDKFVILRSHFCSGVINVRSQNVRSQ